MNFDIAEFKGDIHAPTDTSGEKMTANETPLEADGSVPMINPTSDFADIKPSSVNDKNAVRAFSYGSYENANTAEEPVRFDGRPKGYHGSDPRMGDEMGYASRDYSMQHAGNEGKSMKAAEQHVVKQGSASKKTIGNFSRSYYGSSNALIGIIAALLFGLIGCALWCGAGYLLNTTAAVDAGTKSTVLSVCAFLPTLFTFIGYRIGGDCFDTKGIVISAIMTVIMDAVGLAAVLVTGDMQKNEAALGYGISIEKAVNNVIEGLKDPSSLSVQLMIACGVMIVSLIIALVIAGKKKV